MRVRHLTLVLLAPFCATAGLFAQESLGPVLLHKDLDPQVFREWVQGKERALEEKLTPQQVVWTRDARPANGLPRWGGVKFGAGNAPGPRHLRVGFLAPTAVGTVVVGGSGRVSVLQPGAAYPGDLADEKQWLAGERIAGGKVTSVEQGAQHIAVWVLPAGIKTRAVRLTHDADVTEKTYAAHVSGMVVLAERWANVAPQAIVSASANGSKSNLLTNESVDGIWGTWDNWNEANPPQPVAEVPATILLNWGQSTPLRGLATLWAGFGAVEVQAFVGPVTRHPREGLDKDWQTVFSSNKIENYYPYPFAPQWLDFGKTITARAVRLRLVGVTREGHPHLKGRTQDGRRVWLGDVLALRPLDAAPLETAILKKADTEPKPPLAIRFTLKEAGYVTLVIDDLQGKRVRNLISETWFPAGANVAWWDGQDDLGRDAEAAHHGIYHVPGQFVAPGKYRVRGLWGPSIDLRYEFPVYTEGKPAWNTVDHTGAWLANHSPPSSALFVPADRAPGGRPLVFLGSFVSEGTHGLAWVDLDGKVQGGMNWVGGVWTGAPLLARDDGPKAVNGVHAYAGVVWSVDKTRTKAEARFTALVEGGERSVVKHHYERKPGNTAGDDGLEAEFGGLAAHNGLLYMSLRRQNHILVVDARTTTANAAAKETTGKLLGTLSVTDPRGLAFDPQGRLFILAGKTLLRQSFPSEGQVKDLPAPETLIAAGLEDPQQVTLGADGSLFITDWGTSHQVKVFTSVGKPARTIGKPGGPQLGAYDPERMHHPKGLTIDNRGRLWVAERDEQPKRVSLWSLDGQFVRGFYGPAEYGGGGVLDPLDVRRFYYHGMEFNLDWATGGFRLKSVYYRPGPTTLERPIRGGYPTTPVYHENQQYFSNCHHSNPVGGAATTMVWRLQDGIAVPCACIGRASNWPLLQKEDFVQRWPEKAKAKDDVVFLWVDRNGDGVPQPDEVTLHKGKLGGVTMMPDLALVVSRLEDRTLRLPPLGFTSTGVPLYDFSKAEVLAENVLGPKSSGGDQALVHANGWTILTLGLKPFAAQSLCGVFKGQARWSYPSVWPGLHASHEAPVPDRPGMLIGTTRLLGDFITPPGSDAGPLWIVNGNMGAMYVFTHDGLFVRTLFRDFRVGRPWSMPFSERGMLLNEVTSNGENFWPSVTQTKDGKVFLVDGARTSLVRVEHLDKLQRLPDQDIVISEKDLQAAQDWHAEREIGRQKTHGQEVLKVALRAQGPVVDGKLDDWAGAQWAAIDQRGVRAWFNSNSKPYNVAAAVAIAGDRLYVAYRAGEKDLLRNSGEAANAPFKTGGALDLMLATDPDADPRRTQPAPGDVRLLVTLVPFGKKKETRPLALVYRAVVPGTAEKDRVPFSSPWRTIFFDRVDDVTSHLDFASAEGDYELSIPLKALSLQVKAGTTLRGDLGVLRGDGLQTIQRVYWNNKATSIVQDVPSEAMLTPHLWGTWSIVAEDKK